MYAAGGVERFEACSEHRAPVRLYTVLRDPVAKFWSYFWELKAYRGEWDRVHFGPWVQPKLARTRECLQREPNHPL